MNVPLLIGLAMSAGIGLSLGFIGGGGSIITVPVLVYALGIPPYQAVGMSLAVVGATSLIGAAMHAREGNVRLKTAFQFGGAGVLGAYFGSGLTQLLSPAALLMTFAGLMLVIATVMLTKKNSDKEFTTGENGSSLRKPSFAKTLMSGLAVGVLTGFLGVGGGFLIVPALVIFAALPMKKAIGTSLAVISINCAAGFLGHWKSGQFDLRLTFLVTSLAVLGTLIGASLSHNVSSARLSRAFALFVILVGLFIILKNCAAFV